MKMKNTVILKGLILFLILVDAPKAHAVFRNLITVDGVTVSKANTATSDYAGYRDCSDFKGTLENNSITLTPTATGGSGSYRHTVIYRFGTGYEGYNINEEQFEINVNDGNSFNINLPPLRNEIPYVQQGVLLITKDLSTGEAVSTEKLFTVSRSVILAPTADAKMANQNCFQRYSSFPSTIGVLSNGSTNASQLVLKQGIEKVWESNKGKTWGFYISPFSWVSIFGFSLGNILSINKEYFTSVSKQTTEKVEVSTDYQLSPGDFVQIYTQKTRYVTNYDAITVGACGETKTFSGAYKLQWWGFAYHAVTINPYSTKPINPDNIGAKVMNTCSAELTPTQELQGTLPFYGTNL